MIIDLDLGLERPIKIRAYRVKNFCHFHEGVVKIGEEQIYVTRMFGQTVWTIKQVVMSNEVKDLLASSQVKSPPLPDSSVRRAFRAKLLQLNAENPGKPINAYVTDHKHWGWDDAVWWGCYFGSDEKHQKYHRDQIIPWMRAQGKAVGVSLTTD